MTAGGKAKVSLVAKEKTEICLRADLLKRKNNNKAQGGEPAFLSLKYVMDRIKVRLTYHRFS